MPFLQSSGAISILNLRDFFPGLGNGNSLSNYYRGGGRVPTTKQVSTRTPASGDLYNISTDVWIEQFDSKGGLSTYTIRFGGVVVGNFTSAANLTSYTSGSATYYRSTDRGGGYYAIYRIAPSTVNINTGIPSSGAISLNQFYGAEKP